ncbi:MAG: hypothetical protein RL139_1588 [Gemmatimonadota bacterium]
MCHPEKYRISPEAFKARRGSIALSFTTMDTLALRLAAAGGRIDDFAVSQLVAAGFTLLQRSAPLVRAMAGRRAGLLLAPSPAWVVALAASDGRGAVVLDPASDAANLAAQISALDVGACFTIHALASRVPATLPTVLLDEAPTAAEVVGAGGARTQVDLGSHFGLTIEGATDVAGRDEECLVLGTPPQVLTHRAVLERADWSAPLLRGCVTPLLKGEHVRT